MIGVFVMRKIYYYIVDFIDAPSKGYTPIHDIAYVIGRIVGYAMLFGLGYVAGQVVRGIIMAFI